MLPNHVRLSVVGVGCDVTSGRLIGLHQLDMIHTSFLYYTFL